jgi:hypothetical protein
MRSGRGTRAPPTRVALLAEEASEAPPLALGGGDRGCPPRRAPAAAPRRTTNKSTVALSLIPYACRRVVSGLINATPLKLRIWRVGGIPVADSMAPFKCPAVAWTATRRANGGARGKGCTMITMEGGSPPEPSLPALALAAPASCAVGGGAWGDEGSSSPAGP